MNKNILFIAYFYPPVTGTGIAGSQRILRFLRYLKTEESHILTINSEKYPEHIQVNKKIHHHLKNVKVHRSGVFDIFKILLKARFLLNKVLGINKNIGKCHSENTRNDMNLGKNDYHSYKDMITDLITYPDFGYPWLVPGIFRGIKIIRKYKIDIIFTTGMPWTSLIIGYFLKLLTDKKLIVDFRDPWVGNPYIDKGKLKGYLDSKSESLIVHKADLVIANTEALKKEMEKRYSDIKSKIMVLPNGYDINDFKDIPEIKLPKDRLVISHAGYLYSQRDPMSLLMAIESMTKDNPKHASIIQFNQIGIIKLNYDLEEYCQQKGLKENVKTYKQMDHKTCLGYMAASDVLLLIQPGTKTQIPSKLYEYIYLEKPILAITEKNSALGQLLVKYGFGDVFDPNEYKQIASFLYKMADQKVKKGTTKAEYPQKRFFDARYISSEFENRLQDLKM